MDPDKLQGSWDETKSTLKKRLAILIENKFLFSEDKKIEILNSVQQKLGKTREEISKIVGEI